MLAYTEIQIIDAFLNEMRKPPGDYCSKAFYTPDPYITKKLLTKFLVYYKDKSEEGK